MILFYTFIAQFGRNNFMETVTTLEASVSGLGLEYRDLFKLIERLIHIKDAGQNRQGNLKSLGMLIRYTHLHFIEEEKILNKHSFYPSGSHKESHRQILRYMDTKFLQYQSGDNSALVQLQDKISAWLEAHYTDHDKNFIDFLAKERISIK
jgi:hemerythrin-like metal-binding protein